MQGRGGEVAPSPRLGKGKGTPSKREKWADPSPSDLSLRALLGKESRDDSLGDTEHRPTHWSEVIGGVDPIGITHYLAASAIQQVLGGKKARLLREGIPSFSGSWTPRYCVDTICNRNVK